MQRVAILYDASQAVLSTFDLDEVLNQVLAIVRDYFHLQNGCIMLLDEAAQKLFVRAQFGDSTMPADFFVPFGKGITGTAAKARRPIYSADVTTDPRYIAAHSQHPLGTCHSAHGARRSRGRARLPEQYARLF